MKFPLQTMKFPLETMKFPLQNSKFPLLFKWLTMLEMINKYSTKVYSFNLCILKQRKIEKMCTHNSKKRVIF